MVSINKRCMSCSTVVRDAGFFTRNIKCIDCARVQRGEYNVRCDGCYCLLKVKGNFSNEGKLLCGPCAEIQRQPYDAKCAGCFCIVQVKRDAKEGKVYCDECAGDYRSFKMKVLEKMLEAPPEDWPKYRQLALN